MLVADTISEILYTTMGLLQPQTGDRATGTVTVTADSADVDLGADHWLRAVVNGAVRKDLLYRLDVNPASAAVSPALRDGYWRIPSAGASVALHSVVGGERHNLAAGTVLRWVEPAPAGVGATVTVDPAGLVGATSPAGFGAVKRVGVYEMLNFPVKNLNLFRAGLEELPAVLLIWEGSEPAEGGAGDKIAAVGYGAQAWREHMKLMVVVSRQDSDEQRRTEGLQILDDAVKLLTWQQVADDMALSSPEALYFKNRGRIGADGNMYIYTADFRVTHTTIKKDRGVTTGFSSWLKARVSRPLDGSPALVVPDDDEVSMG